MLLRIHGSARLRFDHGHSAQNVNIGGTQLINVLLGYPDELVDPEAHPGSDFGI